MPDDLVGLGKIAEAAERATREMRELMRDLLAPPTRELGQYFADRMRIFRAPTAIRAMETAHAQIEASALPKQPVEPRVLVPVLEGASLEEDIDLIDRWAGLIATAATTGDTLPAFADILGQITPEEARMLDFMYDNAEPVPVLDEQTLGVDKEALRSASGLAPEPYLVRVQNLHRLELIVQLTTGGLEPVRGFRGWGPMGSVGLTALGEHFVRACRGPAKAVSVREGA
jgi:hypothetical protein